MKKEQTALKVSATINIIVSFLKIWGGTFFSSHALIADGIYTVSDFSTDLLAMIGAKVGHKRANKKHPFGYGRFEYIMQIFIGVIILLVGFYISYKSFLITSSKPNLLVLFLILFVILLKVLSSNYLMHVGKDISSLMLINSAKESFLDVLSSLVIFLLIIVGQFFPFADIIGSLFIALLINITGAKIIYENIILLIGEDDNNIEIKNKLKKIINRFKRVEYSDSFLIKNGGYYQVSIVIAVDEDMSVKNLIQIERKLRKAIKEERSLKIKYIDFEIIKR